MGCGSSSESHDDRATDADERRYTRGPQDEQTNASTLRPATEAAYLQCSSMSASSRSVSSASDVPQLFSPASIDRNMCSVREFGHVKDLMKKWSTWAPPRTGSHLDMSVGTDASEPRSPRSSPVAEAMRLVEDSLKHRATETKYFGAPHYFTALDVVTMTGILAHGHGPRACTAAADASGLGIEHIAVCLDLLVGAVAPSVCNAYREKSESADLARAPRAPVAAQGIVGEMTRTLFGPNAALEDPFVFAPPDRRGLEGTNNYDRFLRAVVTALKTLYIACGGTSALAGNLGQTGLPMVRSIDRIFAAFRGYVIGADGELLLPHADAVTALAEFGTVLAWIGLVPRPKPGSRAAEGGQAIIGSIFGQGPLVLVSPATRRALLLLEFRVHRGRQDAPLRFPRIRRRHGTIGHAIRAMARSDLLPKTMAAFSQASVDPANQCFAARPMYFTEFDAKDSIASPGFGANLPGASASAVGLHSPESPSGPGRPAATFINLGARLLVSRAGDSVDVRKAFGIVNVAEAEFGLTLSLGHPCVEGWETVVESGDIVEVGLAAHHVLEVSLVSANTEDVEAGTALVGLVEFDEDRIELIVVLQRLGHNGEPDSDSMSGTDNGEPMESRPVWLRKRVTPLFLPNRGGEYRFNDSLLQLSPEGVVLAETSVTSHLAGLQESKMRANESLRQMSQASTNMDKFVDHRSRKLLLETLQQFYFLGVLIALAVVRDEPIRLRLPVLLFRILKSYRPSAAPAAMREQASPRGTYDDADPTSSSFTTNPDYHEEDRQPTFSCHFVPTVEDLKEAGLEGAVERVDAVRRLAYVEYERMLEREHLPAGTPKDDYIRDIIVAPAVANQSLRVYIDATFIALADSGIHRSVTWQMSSPEDLRDICCRGV